jgi:hypothetical protein
VERMRGRTLVETALQVAEYQRRTDKQ